MAGKYERWTEEECNIILNNVGKSIEDLFVLLPNRNVCAIVWKVRKLGVYNKYGKKTHWSEDEIEILKKYYIDSTTKEMRKLLPLRSVVGIRVKAASIGLKRRGLAGTLISKEAFDDLYFNQQKSTKEIAVMYNVDKCAVKRLAKTYGIKLRTSEEGNVISSGNRTGSKSAAFTGYEEISGNYMYQIRKGAESRNLPCSITIEYIWDLFIKQNKKCALSGLDIVVKVRVKNGKQSLRTASLDRIDSSKGYIEGNVQWVHKHVNLIKQNLDEDYFIELCTLIAKNKGNIT